MAVTGKEFTQFRRGEVRLVPTGCEEGAQLEYWQGVVRGMGSKSVEPGMVLGVGL